MVDTGSLRLELDRIKFLIDSGTLHWNKGLLQAIGYREFQSFIEHMYEPNSADLFNEAVELVIRNTIKYSKQQQKWITRLNKTLNIQFVDDAIDIPSILSLINSSCDVLKSGTEVPQWKRDHSS
jgi:tRNA A37 N6-isopentenylltransferase MiaA